MVGKKAKTMTQWVRVSGANLCQFRFVRLRKVKKEIQQKYIWLWGPGGVQEEL
jgi:hypothetical protein